MTTLQKEIMDAANLYAWRTKVRLMKQYMDGKTASWTAEDGVNQFLAVYGTDADLFLTALL